MAFLGEKMEKVTIDEVNRKINNGEEIVFVDSRAAHVWDKAKTKIPGAIRIPPDKAEKRLSNVRKDAYVVTYCT